ncbi:MAG: GNAT family protein [Candidatus Berkelbacteria bacterium]|nr:GNAT family protein [Candidatus Berkelbacteria bacterium]
MKTPVIKSEHFILRPFRKEDVLSLAKNLNNPEISKNMSRVPYPYTISDAKKWIDTKAKEEKDPKRQVYSFAIDKESQVIGSIGLSQVVPGHKAEVGYWLSRDFWNQGIMSKVIQLVVDFGFKKLKLQRVEAKVFIQNPTSRHVLEKNGFLCEGILKKDVIKKGKTHDVFILAKVI